MSKDYTDEEMVEALEHALAKAAGVISDQQHLIGRQVQLNAEGISALTGILKQANKMLLTLAIITAGNMMLFGILFFTLNGG